MGCSKRMGGVPVGATMPGQLFQLTAAAGQQGVRGSRPSCAMGAGATLDSSVRDQGAEPEEIAARVTRRVK